MAALSAWNGGVILISHDERFITTVAKEVSVFGPLYPGLVFNGSISAVGMWRHNDNKIQRGRTKL